MTVKYPVVEVAGALTLFVWTEGCHEGHALAVDTSHNFKSARRRLTAIGRGLFELHTVEAWTVATAPAEPGEVVLLDQSTRFFLRSTCADDSDEHCGRYMAVLATAVAKATGQDVCPLRTWMEEPPPDGERDPYDDEVAEVFSRAVGVML